MAGLAIHGLAIDKWFPNFENYVGARTFLNAPSPSTSAFIITPHLIVRGGFPSLQFYARRFRGVLVPL
jgi:hypothetical protein